MCCFCSRLSTAVRKHAERLADHPLDKAIGVLDGYRAAGNAEVLDALENPKFILYEGADRANEGVKSGSVLVFAVMRQEKSYAKAKGLGFNMNAGLNTFYNASEHKGIFWDLTTASENSADKVVRREVWSTIVPKLSSRAGQAKIKLDASPILRAMPTLKVTLTDEVLRGVHVYIESLLRESALGGAYRTGITTSGLPGSKDVTMTEFLNLLIAKLLESSARTWRRKKALLPCHMKSCPRTSI